MASFPDVATRKEGRILRGGDDRTQQSKECSQTTPHRMKEIFLQGNGSPASPFACRVFRKLNSSNTTALSISLSHIEVHAHEVRNQGSDPDLMRRRNATTHNEKDSVI